MKTEASGHVFAILSLKDIVVFHGMQVNLVEHMDQIIACALN
jgi:hypothetical protein